MTQVQAPIENESEAASVPRSASLARASSHLCSLQREDGSWEGEMVWCTMILSQYIITHSILEQSHLPSYKSPLADPQNRRRMIRHYEVTRNPDGTWGLHGESQGYLFTTTLAYVALRLLGLSPDDPLCSGAMRFIRRAKQGVLSIPSWGKLWLALCGLYEYEGINPCPPEIFLLPESFPIHPNNYYCHTRYIYLGIAYLSGRRFVGNLGEMRSTLRRELYPGVRYEDIDFAAHRHTIAETDLYVRPSAGLRAAYDLLRLYDETPVSFLRKKALSHCFLRILYEQRTSRYQAISPVNGLLNCLAILAEDPSHPDLAPSLLGLESWKWEDEEEGIRYTGAHSTAWDTAFSLQALLSAPLVKGYSLPVQAIRKGYAFLQDTQIKEELPDGKKERRDPALGGWCFSDGQHRWPVSDCTAEALCAILSAHEHPGLIPLAQQIPRDRIDQAVDFILYRQNPDGGFGTYERRRGSTLLEFVNPSEMYGNCMTERSYIECTASSISALCHYRSAYAQNGDEDANPSPRKASVDRAIAQGVRFLRKIQRADGSYLGFWGINFTYAIFHVVKGLRAAGVPADDPSVDKALSFLLSKQKGDGGFGEHYLSCLEDRYVEHPQSQVVMTSWALLAFAYSDSRRKDVLAAANNATAFLEKVQKEDGSFPRQAQNGVFFGTAMLDYRLYKSYFPAWALSLCAQKGGGYSGRSLGILA